MERSKIIKDIVELMRQSYEKGWNERNAGNISIRLNCDFIDKNKKAFDKIGIYNLPYSFDKLEGHYFALTGSGVYFKNWQSDPTELLGIIKIINGGSQYKIVWGFKNGIPTSEIISHLMCHQEMLNTQNRVVYHAHPKYCILMAMKDKFNSQSFTETIWRVHSECPVVFPNGIGVANWHVPGSVDLALNTSELIAEEFNIVLWPNHGVVVTGKSTEEVFTLLETLEKCCELYVLSGIGGIYLSHKQVQNIATNFNLSLREF